MTQEDYKKFVRAYTNKLDVSEDIRSFLYDFYTMPDMLEAVHRDYLRMNSPWLGITVSSL